MLLNCGVGEDSCESLGLQGDPTSPCTPIDPVNGIYEFTWGDLPRATPYALVAIAHDGSAVDGTELVTRSATVLVGVGDANPPTCRIKAPANLAEVVGNV